MKPVYYGSVHESDEDNPKADDNASEFKFLEVDGFNVYFYCDVDNNNSAKLIKELRTLSKQAERHNIDFGFLPAIKLRLHSYGGYVSSGLAIHDAIRRLPTPIDTYIEGICASAGTLISIAGTRRYMSNNSTFLIHELSGVAWGKYQFMKDQMKLADILMAQITDVYVQYSKQSKSEIEAMLQHDTWLTSEKALEFGFIDAIL